MKCPSCGKKLKSGTTSCPNCGRYCGRTFANKNEDMFLTENKNPQNGGYTQQQQNLTVQYTNPDDISLQNPNDNMFFSTKKNTYNQQQDEKINNSNIFNEQTISDPNENPYDDIFGSIQNNECFSGVASMGSGNYADYQIYGNDETFISPAMDNNENKPHTTEFMPKNVVEFSNYVKARPITQKIGKILLKLMGISLILLIVTILEVKLMGASVIALSGALVNVAVCGTFFAVTKKTYQKIIGAAAAIYTFIFSLAIAYTVNDIIEVAYYTFAIVSIFGLAIRQDVLFSKLIKMLFKYHDLWEDYQLENNA